MVIMEGNKRKRIKKSDKPPQQQEDVEMVNKTKDDDIATPGEGGQPKTNLKDFQMLRFREKLRGSNFIPDLRNFIDLAESSPKIISQYMEKRGQPLELAEAMDRIDKSNLNHVSYICQALQLVLMEVLTNQKTDKTNGINASRFLLKSNGQLIENLLKSSNSQHRKIILKLLTAIVCLEPQLGRQLLSTLDVLTNVKAMEEFLSHSQLIETETVRKCCINFLLSYLIDGNSLLIRNILDKTNILKALISDLIYDDHTTVCVVLSTLKKFVLENREISKTKKLLVFDLETTRKILNLYDWKGPKYLEQLVKRDKKDKNTPLPEDKSTEFQNSKQAVRESLHEFTLLLLCSRKYGIAFDAISNLKQKRNILQGKLLKCINKPWLDDLKIELITKMLCSCPELARTTIKHYANTLNPFKNSSKFFVPIANCIQKMIFSLNPILFKSALDSMTLTDFTYLLKDICLSADILIHLGGKNSLKNVDFEIRLATNRLLLTMYQQYCNYMKAIQDREKYKGQNLQRFKLDILNYIFDNFPTIENILISLYQSIQQQNECNVLEHLEITLDLILLIAQTNRGFVNKTGMIIDYLKMLQPLYSIEGNNLNIELELKAIKTILYLMPNALKPNEDLFKNVLNSFLKIFTSGSGTCQQEAGQLLRGIFFNTGFFENGLLEIDLWLEALRFIDADTLAILNVVFLKCFQCKSDASAENFYDKLDENLQSKFFENIDNNMIIEGYIETPTMNNKLLSLIIDNIKISLELRNYLEIISILLFHYIPRPESVKNCYSRIEELGCHIKYMENWLKMKPGKLINCEMIPNYETVYYSILDGKCNFLEIFQDNENFENFLLDGKEIQLNSFLSNEKLLMIYIQLICFLVSQLKDDFENKVCQSTIHFFSAFTQILWQKSNEIVIESNCNTQSTYLELVLKYFYCNHFEFANSIQLFNESNSNQNFLNFICEITQIVHQFKLENLQTITIHFRSKAISQIKQAVQETNYKHLIPKSLNALKFMKIFKLTTENCMEVLNNLIKLKSEHFLLNETEKSIYFELMILALNRLVELRKAVFNSEIIREISKIYINLMKQDIDLEKFEESLISFLRISHQNIKFIPEELFPIVFQCKRVTKSKIKLATFLFERSSNFNTKFLEILRDNISKKELIYPLLNVAFTKFLEIEPQIKQKIYQEYKNGFLKTIEKPQKSGVMYKENVGTSLKLIADCMPASECLDFTKKNLKIDTVETFQLRLIQAIYQKAIESVRNEEQYRDIFVSYLINYNNFYNRLIMLSDCDSKKIDLLNYFTFDWFVQYHRGLEYNFDKLINSQVWSHFCKNCLKTGMQEILVDTVTNDANNSNFLKILAYLCEKTYTNENSVGAGQTFEMVLSHSRFFDIVLSQKRTLVKTEVFHLLYILAQKNIQVLQQKHIPIFLGAYQAKLHDCDRYILALLQFYEQNSISLFEYKPFVWGESAISHYGLNSLTEVVQHQETSVVQVMSLIDRQTSEFTIQNYPIWRKLNTLKQIPEISFENPLDVQNFGENQLERLIENNCKKFDETLLKLLPKQDEIYQECYDPAFMIPLAIMSFAPEIYSQPVRPVQNGLVAIIFAALSSQDKELRLAAGCCQLRYRHNFENSRFFEKSLWTGIYDNVQNGLDDLHVNWRKHKKSGIPRVPYISGLFLAKSINLLIDPTNSLYKQVTMYMRLKESFDFLCIPAFNIMFHSPEIEHAYFREFILDTICDGIKCSSDITPMITTNSFKAIMGFYGSTMSTLEINLKILEVISFCVQIPASSKLMVDQIGMIAWLNSIIEEIEYYHFDTVEAVITIISNLWYSIEAKKNDFYNYKHIQLNIFNLIIKLSANITARISLKNFIKFLNILEKAANEHHNVLPVQYLDRILNCAQRHFEEQSVEVLNLKEFGTDGIECKQTFCRKLKETNLDNAIIKGLCSLRGFLIKWIEN